MLVASACGNTQPQWRCTTAVDRMSQDGSCIRALGEIQASAAIHKNGFGGKCCKMGACKKEPRRTEEVGDRPLGSEQGPGPSRIRGAEYQPYTRPGVTVPCILHGIM